MESAEHRPGTRCAPDQVGPRLQRDLSDRHLLGTIPPTNPFWLDHTPTPSGCRPRAAVSSTRLSEQRADLLLEVDHVRVRMRGRRVGVALDDGAQQGVVLLHV